MTPHFLPTILLRFPANFHAHTVNFFSWAIKYSGKTFRSSQEGSIFPAQVNFIWHFLSLCLLVPMQPVPLQGSAWAAACRCRITALSLQQELSVLLLTLDWENWLGNQRPESRSEYKVWVATSLFSYLETKRSQRKRVGYGKTSLRGVLPHPDLLLLRYTLVIYCHSLSCEITVTCRVVRAPASLWEKRRNEARQQVLPGRRSFPSTAG